MPRCTPFCAPASACRSSLAAAMCAVAATNGLAHLLQVSELAGQRVCRLASLQVSERGATATSRRHDLDVVGTVAPSLDPRMS